MANVIDAAQIQELLSRQKSRGDYDADLREFLQSGEAGVEIDLTSGRFAGKRAKMVKVGFDNARKKTNEQGLVHPGGNLVKVIAVNDKNDDEGNPKGEVDEKIYLINTALLGGENTEEENAA